MSVNASGADINNIGTITYDDLQKGTTHVSSTFEKSYAGTYTYSGGTSTFDIAEIQLSTDIGGVAGSGMVEVVLAGTHPPSGSSITLKGCRRVVIIFYYSSGTLSSSTLVDDNYDDDAFNTPTVSLVYTGGTTTRSTIAIRTAFTDSTSTLIWRQSTHVKLYTGGLSGPGQLWALT